MITVDIKWYSKRYFLPFFFFFFPCLSPHVFTPGFHRTLLHHVPSLHQKWWWRGSYPGQHKTLGRRWCKASGKMEFPKLPGSHRRKTWSHTSTTTVLQLQEDIFHCAFGACGCWLQVLSNSSGGLWKNQWWWGVCQIGFRQKNGVQNTSWATQYLSAWCCSPGWCAIRHGRWRSFPTQALLDETIPRTKPSKEDF